MATPITVTIRNQQYRIVAEEEEDYILACADMVNKALHEAITGTTLSLADGAVLAAMNLADRCCKERQVTDNLRAQLKEALDENARLSKELGERRRKSKPGREDED